MTPFIICTLLLLKAALADSCASQKFTASGQCCSLCPAGFQVEVECGKEDTKCAPCPKGTFSASEGLSPCLPCARCPVGLPEVDACSAVRDTHCECGERFYLWRDGASVEGLCALCSSCRRGEGAVRQCDAWGNAQCRLCAPGTFSEEHNHAKACQTCTRCADSEVEIRACMPNSDTLCMDRKLHILARPAESDGSREGAASPRWPGLLEEVLEEEEGGEASPAPGGGGGGGGGGGDAAGSPNKSTPGQDEVPAERGNNILAYVSVLAAVVLGLLLYVAYKCWMSCKQKKALSKARVAELGTSPEGEKLHSDSGVFLDSHSIQDNQPSKGSRRDSKPDNRLYVNLPPHRQEEVERLLEEAGGASGWGWWQLGSVLGYESEQLEVFGRGEAPARTLLSTWAQQEGSTLGLLCSALGRIDRPDVASLLTCPTQGVSVV